MIFTIPPPPPGLHFCYFFLVSFFLFLLSPCPPLLLPQIFFRISALCLVPCLRFPMEKNTGKVDAILILRAWHGVALFFRFNSFCC